MKNILITGGTTGIGLSTAKKFLEMPDNRIISISRNESKIQFVDNRLKYFFADISSTEELTKVFEQVKDEYGNIDIIINNAGVIIPGGVETLSCEDWKHSLDINLSGYYNVTKIFLPLLKKSENPCIINISSISAKLGGSSVAYSVAKAGVDMLTNVLARELFKYGIRVNAVSPGVVNSGFQVANGMLPKENYDGFLQDLSHSYPLGIGDVSEISNAVYFLSSDKAKWITGSNLTVDGGKSIMI